jgi:hypothetical protein
LIIAQLAVCETASSYLSEKNIMPSLGQQQKAIA